MKTENATKERREIRETIRKEPKDNLCFQSFANTLVLFPAFKCMMKSVIQA